MTIGLLRHWNNEIYITPEIIKKKDPQYLLIRKLELDLESGKNLHKEALSHLKDKILTMIKDSEKNSGIDIEKIILELKEHPDVINSEIKKILEESIHV